MRSFSLLLGGVVLAGATLIPVSSEASIKVIGSGFGRICYEHAMAGHPSDEGIKACNQALADQEQTESDRAATFVNRGILLMYARHFEPALSSYEEALKVNPELAEAYVNKGVALVNLGRDAEAVTAFSRGLELNPGQPELAYYSRGVANEMLGNLRAAYRDYQQAAALKPDWQEPQHQLQRFSISPKPRR